MHLKLSSQLENVFLELVFLFQLLFLVGWNGFYLSGSINKQSLIKTNIQVPWKKVPQWLDVLYDMNNQTFCISLGMNCQLSYICNIKYESNSSPF